MSKLSTSELPYSLGGALGAIYEPQDMQDKDHVDSPEHGMLLALYAAMAAIGRGRPNPTVGAVVVKDQQILARGATQPWGGVHGEVEALSKVTDSQAKGADVYVTLEPCSHTGKQPPCVEALIRAGIRRCFVGMLDPDSRVAGRGVTRLKEAGVEVQTGVLQQACELWHMEHTLRCQKQKPLLWVAKWAQTLDGCLAGDDGVSQWITGPKAQVYTHWLRQRYSAIMVGARTFIYDKPQLTSRNAPLYGQQPLKVICDPKGLLAGVSEDKAQELWQRCLSHGQSLILSAAAVQLPRIWLNQAQVLVKPLERGSWLDRLQAVMESSELEDFYGQPLASVLVEGGARLLTALDQRGVFDIYHAFIAPKLLGSRQRLGLGEAGMDVAFSHHRCLELVSQHRLGDDMLLELLVR